ncbi:uncharacterized protein PFL1_00521 [Pseudozyma flocculosa PF-1]|uniref:uncharacterized protein n=1 Tax=Pseudozyma flocculosa PF-1 TaxID=1277687 RepID=UPI00045608CB|nr:uncharacterized protein PFL1_00521 [Pseudozyma flocculosa PF-1]EPQ32325.1 hypothetical protein PFL1_00521 [Pseudozyma flocculosa PF-1]
MHGKQLRRDLEGSGGTPNPHDVRSSSRLGRTDGSRRPSRLGTSAETCFPSVSARPPALRFKTQLCYGSHDRQIQLRWFSCCQYHREIIRLPIERGTVGALGRYARGLGGDLQDLDSRPQEREEKQTSKQVARDLDTGGEGRTSRNLG